MPTRRRPSRPAAPHHSYHRTATQHDGVALGVGSNRGKDFSALERADVSGGGSGHSGAVRATSGQHEPVLHLSVPMPPSTNHLYATVNGRRVKTREAREYAQVVSTQVWLWIRMFGDPPDPPYRLTIVLHPPSRRRLDVSNSIKCLEDGVFDGLESNDREVIEVVAKIGDRDPLNPRAEVTLEHIDAARTVEED